MKMTGQILKENRERKGISISEVAIATKINNKILIAIEEGNVDQLPPKTFLRGFVRAYAAYLELDVESVMATYLEEMGSSRPKADLAEEGETNSIARPAQNRQKPAPNDANDAINPKTSLAVKAGAVAGILILVILIVVFKNKMESYEREALDKSVPGGIAALSTPEPDSEAVPMTAPDAAAAAAGALASGNTSATTSSQITGQTSSPTPAAASAAATAPSPTPSPTPAATATPTPAPTPTPTPKPTATPTPTPAPTATPSPTPTPKPTPTPTPTPAPVAAAAATPAPTPTPTSKPGGKTHEILVEALDNVTIDAQVDDESSKKLVLRAEQVQNIKAKRKAVLRFSDGGAVNIIVNGTERGVPGDLGKPIRVELP